MHPKQLQYDTKIMRKHLHGCFSDKIFRHFPARHRQVVQDTRRREVVPVFCVYRQPKADNDKMIACDECNEWYHSHYHNELGRTQTLSGLALAVLFS